MKKTLIVLSAVAFVILTGCGSGGALGPKPVAAIETDLRGLNELLEKNMDKPDELFEKVHVYVQDHLPDFNRNCTLVAVELDKIKGAGDREKRMKEIMEELSPALKNLKGTVVKMELLYGDDTNSGDESKDDKKKDYKKFKADAEAWAATWKNAGVVFGNAMEDNFKDLDKPRRPVFQKTTTKSSYPYPRTVVTPSAWPNK